MVHHDPLDGTQSCRPTGLRATGLGLVDHMDELRPNATGSQLVKLSTTLHASQFLNWRTLQYRTLPDQTVSPATAANSLTALDNPPRLRSRTLNVRHDRETQTHTIELLSGTQNWQLPCPTLPHPTFCMAQTAHTHQGTNLAVGAFRIVPISPATQQHYATMIIGVWDCSTRELLTWRELVDYPDDDEVTAIAATSTQASYHVFFATSRGDLHRLAGQTGHVTTQANAHTHLIHELCAPHGQQHPEGFDSNRQRLVSLSESGTIAVHEPHTLTTLQRLQLPQEVPARLAACTSMTGDIIAGVAAEDGSLTISNLTSGHTLTTLVGHIGCVTRIAIEPSADDCVRVRYNVTRDRREAHRSVIVNHIDGHVRVPTSSKSLSCNNYETTPPLRFAGLGPANKGIVPVWCYGLATLFSTHVRLLNPHEHANAPTRHRS